MNLSRKAVLVCLLRIREHRLGPNLGGNLSKKLFTIIIAAVAVAAFAGCSNVQSPNTTSVSATPTKVASFSTGWEKSSPIKSSTISADLFKAGVCQSEPDLQASDTPYTGEGLTAYKADQWRICNSYKSSEKDDAQVVCKSTITIYTDKLAGTNVRRSLGYEDGFWDLALLYGKGWEVQITPLDAAPGNEGTVSAGCQPLLSKITNAVGGSVSLYGQY